MSRKRVVGKVWREKATRLRAIMAKIDKIDPAVADNVINPSDYVRVKRYTGIDIKYETPRGTTKTVRLYGKKGINLAELSRTELTAIRDSVNREYLDKVLPKSLLEAQNKGPITRAMSSGKFRQKRLGESVALLKELGIRLDPNQLDDKISLDDFGEEQGSQILNHFYHVFGAKEENILTLNAYKQFMKA